MEPEDPLASSPQIFMKYGRQRWKLKGRIEVNGKQSWDGEEMVFLPLIVGFISIKVRDQHCRVSSLLLPQLNGLSPRPLPAVPPPPRPLSVLQAHPRTHPRVRAGSVNVRQAWETPTPSFRYDSEMPAPAKKNKGEGCLRPVLSCKAFLPSLSHQVTELKGLATHLLVGSVTCETKELFAARPQVVAVDINDLGTIKLNLEITW